MKEERYNAKDVIEYLKLPYGRNTFYKKLRELGFLDKANYPSKEMQDKKLITVAHPLAIGFNPVNVPIFTKSFILFIEKHLLKNEAT